jgi:hypothetical protein
MIQSNEGTPPTNDNITVNITNLDGDSLIEGGALSFGYPPGGIAKWHLTDATLLANGFILSGNIVLTGTLERTESDKIEIAFGNAKLPGDGAVPEPFTMITGFLAISGLGAYVRRHMKAKAAARS